MYIITAIICIFGIITYQKLSKENFPEIVIPTIYIATVYPGTSPTDMENLVTDQIEKQLKSISGIKKLTSNSIQDFSTIMVEFNTSFAVEIAKQKVKDAVDKAKRDLPNDLPTEPTVVEVDFSEIPIMNVNISGDAELSQLKKLAEQIQDEIEGLKEITRADMVGAPDREVQVNIDMYKMALGRISFHDIENAIAFENITISGGYIDVENKKRAIRIVGQFTSPTDLENLIIRSPMGAPITLKEIADIKYTWKEKESYARYNGNNVIALNIIKRSGQNLINASDKIKKILARYKSKIPRGIYIDITGDSSEQTRTTLHDLNNTIIIGFILVLLILMFFMGVTNALFVALSVPLSIFLGFLVLPLFGFGLNMIVLFALLFALGIIVDDAIVVIENTYRLYAQGQLTIIQAAKLAAGEIFVPVLSGTLTTLCPFIPLAFWQGIVGKFMFYLPITLIITLIASLIVAFVINPVFAVSFMKPIDKNKSNEKFRWHNIKKPLIIMGFIALCFYAIGFFFGANLMVFFIFLYLLYKIYLYKIIRKFEHDLIPRFVNIYGNILKCLMYGFRPIWVCFITIGLFVLSIIMLIISKPSVVFFPSGEPNFTYIYLQLPVGTKQSYTDSITLIVEEKVKKLVANSNIVTSVTSNVAVGASDPSENDRTAASHKARISVVFKKIADRQGESSKAILNQIRESIKDMPGVRITVAQENAGPPVGAPINLEFAGDDVIELRRTTESFKRYIDSLGIEGIENLKSDFVAGNPELLVYVDREKAAREGISTAQVGMELRTAIFGKEVSKYKTKDDDYPINIRVTNEQRTSIETIMALPITFMDMSSGRLKQIPISAIADVTYENSYGGIKHKNTKRVITLSSNVIDGFNPNEINAKLAESLQQFNKPSSVTISFTGEQEEQQETTIFLLTSLCISMLMIFMILQFQFNSISKALIIMVEILLSFIGVFFGFAFTRMEMPIIMVGVGIVGLAGIVVKNGILLVEFADKEMDAGHNVYDAIINAGRTRLKPVLLTASACILGLIPLAIGLNIDFYSLFAHGNPKFFLGGDSVVFWGPLSWTIIFGLSFTTFLTLFLVPALYIINEKFAEKIGPRLTRIF